MCHNLYVMSTLLRLLFLLDLNSAEKSNEQLEDATSKHTFTMKNINNICGIQFFFQLTKYAINEIANAFVIFISEEGDKCHEIHCIHEGKYSVLA